MDVRGRKDIMEKDGTIVTNNALYFQMPISVNSLEEIQDN